MALEFVRQLAATTCLRLTATVVFNFPTIQLLTREIARRMDISLDEEPPAQRVSVSPRKATPVAVESTEEQAIEALMSAGKKSR
jgi:hypothetical protein